jgi:ATP-dependent protease HslVU (ClpYQ) peptidase subunit
MAIKDGSVVVLASDSGSSNEDAFSTRSNSKIWTIQDIHCKKVLVGFCGLFSTCQFLRYSFKWPKITGGILEYLVATQQVLIKQLNERFWHDSQKECIQDWSLLFCVGRQIFMLDSLGDVEECEADFAAIGNAADVATGALYALSDASYASWEKLEAAFDACTRVKCNIKGPLNILTTI